MAFWGGFIGINKYMDSRVNELTGACRDAIALWSLFKDSIPEMSAKLLINENATTQAVLDMMSETLSSAGPDDTVVVFFSGHGTRNHRLVMYDTQIEHPFDTTISMEKIAELFRESNAKLVILILDCCFSGGAAAKVFDDFPVAKDAFFDWNNIVGTGRVIITASSANEPAYEHPGVGHGILTKALLDVLQSEEVGVSLVTAMDSVLMRVRAECGRLGLSQTPELLGHFEGGVFLPSLRPGENYYRNFPELQIIKVSNNITDLLQYNIPESVCDYWGTQFANGLNNLQVKAINEHGVLSGNSLLVVAPTSSGKTFIGEMASIRAIKRGRKVVFLLPYKALVNEKFEYFSELYGEKINVRVIRCSGDYYDQTEDFVRGRYDLAVLTYEMFLNLAVSRPSVLTKIGLIVLDEAQFITDPNRGIIVELILTNLIAAREKEINPQIIALSAVIGDINNFHIWLGCQALISNERPVPLIEGVLDRTGVYQYLDEDGQEKTAQLLPATAIRVRGVKQSSQDVIIPLVAKLVGQGETVIVFRNTRGLVQGCARYLAKNLGLDAATDVISRLPDQDITTTSEELQECLRGGIGFHCTDLDRDERQAVEQAFRASDSKVRVLVATTTIAAGINTPASTVIIAEHEFMGSAVQPYTVAEYKNMAGRAGRLGYNEKGKAILLAATYSERDTLFKKYVVGKLEPLRSSFNVSEIDTWILRLLAQEKAVHRDDVFRILANTYGGFLQSRLDPTWREKVEAHLQKLLPAMLELNLLEQDGEIIQLSLLGRACGQSSLSLKSSLQLVELLLRASAEDLTPEKLMALMQALPEADQGYTPILKKGRSESDHAYNCSKCFGSGVMRELQRKAQSESDYFARCKRALILWDWINGVSIGGLERKYTVNDYARTRRGDIGRFADSTRHHMHSAHQIMILTRPEDAPRQEEYNVLLQRLEFGIPLEALLLLKLPFTLNRGQYLALLERGIRTPEDLRKQDEDWLVKFLGKRKAYVLMQN